MRKILGCLIFLIIMMTSQILAGTVYYVDGTNGNDANPGTEFLPWRTIQKAANSMVAGDTAIVKAGTYDERVSESTSGSSGNPIIYQVSSGDTVICRGFTISGNYITIDSFDIDSNTDNWTTGRGVHVSSDNIIVQNCNVYECPYGGIYFGPNSSNGQILNNQCYHNGQNGIEVRGSYHLVENNEIWESVQYHPDGGPSSGADADGMRFHGNNHTFRGNYIHEPALLSDPYNINPHIDCFQTFDDGSGGNAAGNYCTFERNHCRHYVSGHFTFMLEGTSSRPAHHLTIKNNLFEVGWGICCGAAWYQNNIYIYNNTFIGDPSFTTGWPLAIELGGVTSYDVRNNITVDYRSNGIHRYITGGSGTCDYNCTWNSNSSSVSATPGEQANEVWETNPQFVNFIAGGGGDYRLASGSPCIDVGGNLSGSVNNDYNGNSRPHGAGYDIGAYEYYGVNPPLSVNINAFPTSGEVPIFVNFTGSATGGVLPYSYSWDFGDGTSSSEQNPSHTYSEAGDYTVYLTVTDSNSNQDSDSLTINASAVIIPLQASFIASPTSGEAPLTVSFTGSATGGTEPYTYSWDFGDSTSSSEQNPSHTYNDPGDYTVTLTVTDSDSNQDSNSLSINASAIITALVASFIASPTSGEVPLTINFTGNATGGAPPYSYNWSFDDGTSSSEQNPSHTYSQAGDFTVTLTVTDSQSNQDSDSATINASASVTPLVVSCTASSTSGEIPFTVDFTGNATGGIPPYNYNWDFGDGNSSSGKNPSHPYSQVGDYTVTFTVTDSDSSQDTDSLIINAYDPDAPLIASCAGFPISGEIPLTVNFTGNASGGVPPYTYTWGLGDSYSSTEQNPSHTYNDAGDYTVTLTVTDSESNQDYDSLTINASALIIPLEASSSASPTSGEVPLTVNFTGNATGGVLPYSYSWDFGDGTSSSEQNPSHIYSQAGDYTAHLIVTDSESDQDNDSLIINVFADEAYISCSPAILYFGASTSGYETTEQNLRIINAGHGQLSWNIEDNADWLSCSPSSGLGRRKIAVSVNASGLPLGLYTATITVSSPEAYNSPQYVAVNLRVYESGQDSSPFGYFDTPVDGSVVSGSIPITGWALDDIEVIRLEIKRNSAPEDLPEAIGSDGLVYIGDAVFVEGAWPDVEKSYPDYPLSYRAGWGYTLFTNDLPYRGNGSFTIYGFAYDASGHKEEIGRKTILCDNANSIKPFGTIDTPEQGEIIRGSDYIIFGWALTPPPKTIPKDGSTILVCVDGVQVGHPVYDQYREDIAALYPEYNNAQGAVGYFYLDTTQYENGMHTISWIAMDDEGEVDEIGTRYFFIDNIETGLKSINPKDTEERIRKI